MYTFVMSDKYPQFCKEIQKMGNRVISSDTIDLFHSPEQKHADMQVLPINDKIFILNECVKLKNKLSHKNLIFCSKKAGKSYPENILLNCLFMNNTLYGKLSATDKNVLEYCKSCNIKTVNVNQGYTRCSTLIINQNTAITSDPSISKALNKNGAEVLLISPGNIVLEGFDYGFIGGASTKINDTIFFFGNLENHPDYIKIKEFCFNHNSNIELLCKNMPLTDIGGIVKTG